MGLCGILFNKRNLLVMLVAIELVFLGINLNLIIVSIYLDDIIGQILVFFVLTVVTGESAIALSLFTIIYQFRKTLTFMVIHGYFTHKF
jgi:NADH-quinone oxidoreductase subunit K